MAEEPPFANFPQFDPSDIFLDFPEGELPLLDGNTSDLGLDDILDFSFDDLLPPSSDEKDNAGSGSKFTTSSNSNSKFTTSSNSNSGSNPGLPESGSSSAASGVVVVHQEDSRLKRKMDDDDSPSPIPRLSHSPNSNCNPSTRNFKIRRSKNFKIRRSKEVSTPSAGTEEDEKRKAKNRESAQLSRLRKKHYVEELEEKVKILTRKLSFSTAENDRLRRQLNGGGGGYEKKKCEEKKDEYKMCMPYYCGRAPLIPEYAMWPNGIPHPEHAMRPNGIPHPEHAMRPNGMSTAKVENVEELEEKVKELEEKVKILNQKLSLSTAENDRLRRQLNRNGAGYEKKSEEKKSEKKKDEKKEDEYKMCLPYYCGRAPLIPEYAMWPNGIPHPEYAMRPNGISTAKIENVEELEEKVKELEEKVKILNRKLSLSTAENDRLRRQLNGNGAGYEKKYEEKKSEKKKDEKKKGEYAMCMPYYCGRAPLIPEYAMWPNGIPHPEYAMGPNGISTATVENVGLHVSLLGLLLVILVFVVEINNNIGLGGSWGMVYGGVGGGNDRISSVKELGPVSGKIGSDNYGGNKRYEKGREGPGANQNSSNDLPHVEINDNLITRSPLTSERDMAQSKSKGQGKQSSGKEGTGLAIPAHMASALAVPMGATRDVGIHSKACRNSAERPRPLASDSHDAYRDNIESTVPDGPFQQWFREGLADMDVIYMKFLDEWENNPSVKCFLVAA